MAEIPRNIANVLDLDFDTFFKDVPRKPLGLWDSIKQGIKVPYLDPQMFAAIAFESDPNENTAQYLLNTANVFGSDDPGFVRFAWKDVQEDPKKFWDWFKQTLGTSLGYQFSPIASAAAFGPVGYATVAGSQYFIDNMKTRAAEYMRRVDEDGEAPPETPGEFKKTLLASSFQMGLDMFGFKLFGLQKLMGFSGKNQAKDMANKIVRETIEPEKDLSSKVLGTLGRGVAVGAGIEVPQEVAQTVAERYQANLPLTGDEANEQYLEAAMGGFFLGSSIGTSMDVLNRFNNNRIQEQPTEIPTTDVEETTGRFDVEKVQAQPRVDEDVAEKIKEAVKEPDIDMVDPYAKSYKKDKEFKGVLEGEDKGEVKDVVETDIFKEETPIDDVNIAFKNAVKEGDTEADFEYTNLEDLKESYTGAKYEDNAQKINDDIKDEDTSEQVNEIEKQRLNTAETIKQKEDSIKEEESKQFKVNNEKTEREISNLNQVIKNTQARKKEKEDKELFKQQTKQAEDLAEKARFRKLSKSEQVKEIKAKIAEENAKTANQIGLEREKNRLKFIRSKSFDRTALGVMANDLTDRLKTSADKISDIERQINDVYGKGQLISLGLMRQINGLLNSGKINASNFVAATRPEYSTSLSPELIQMFSTENRRKALAESKLGRPQLLNLQKEVNDYVQNWQLHKDILELTERNPKLIGTEAEIRDESDTEYIPSDYFGGKRDIKTELFRPLTSDATTAIQANNIQQALDVIAKENPKLRKIAEKLKKFNLNTGIKYEEVVDTFGKRGEAKYDADTNTITIDPEYGGSPHALLHEATHAATHGVLKKDANLKKPKHFLVKQIREIFEESKQFIDPDLYRGAFRFEEKAGAVFDLEEFVAEFFSNPEFQQALSEYRYKNTNMSLLDRVVNFVRRLLNLPEKGVAELNNLIGKILQTSENHPVKRTLFSAAIRDGKAGIEGMTFDQISNAIKSQMPFSEKNISFMDRFLDKMPGGNFLRQFQPLNYVIRSAEANTPDYVGQKFRAVYDTIRQKGGYLLQAREQAGLVTKRLVDLRDTDPNTFRKFAKLATETTEFQVLVADEKGNPLNPNNPAHAALIAKDKAVKLSDKLYDEKITQRLRREYKKFGKPYHNAYAALVKSYKDQYEFFIKTVGEQLDSFTNIDPQTLGFIKNVLNRGLENSKTIAPYLALNRFGDFKVSLLQIDNSPNPVDGRGYARRVEHFESAAARDQFIAEFKEDVLRKTPKEDRQKIINITNKFNAYGREGLAVSPIKDLNSSQINALSPDRQRAYNDLRNDFNQLSKRGQFLYSVYNSPTSFNNFYDLAKDPDILRNLPSKNVLKQLEKILNESNASEEAKQGFYEYAFASMPDVLLGDILRKRSNPVVLGASPDIIRSYSTSIENMISKGASIKYNKQLDTEINSLRENIRRDAMSGEGVNYTNGNVEKAQELLNLLSNTAKFAQNPTDSNLAGAITATTYHWFLGFNISSALIQSTNIPLVLYPSLGGRYGFGTAANAILEASKILKNAGLTRTIKDPTNILGDDKTIDSASILNYSEAQLKRISKAKGYDAQDLVKLRTKLRDFGQIGRSNEQEHLNIGKSPTEQTSKVRRYFSTLLKGSSFLFNMTEQANREISALAAFDLEYKKALKDGLSKAQAYEKAEARAVDAVERYNGGISRETTSAITRMDRTGIVRVITLFKNYGFFLYSHMFDVLKTSLPRGLLGNKASKEDIDAARRTLAGILGASYILGGVKGLPFFFVPEIIYNSFFRDDGEEDLAELTTRLFGEAPIDRLLDIRISGRTSFNEVIFQTPRIDDDTLRGSLQSYALQFLGPSFSAATQAVGGLDDIRAGNFQTGIEKMIPTALSNVSKGFRYYTEGVVNKRGDVIMEPLGLIPSFANGVGLKTLPVYLSTDVPFNANKRIRELDNKKQGYLEKLEKASKMGDVEKFNKAYEDLLEFGEKEITTPIGRIKIKDYYNINRASIAKSLRLRLSRDKPYGMYINPRYEDLYKNVVEDAYKRNGIAFADGMITQD